MARLSPLDTRATGDTGDPRGVEHGDESGVYPSAAGDRGGSERRVQSIVTDSCSQSVGEFPPSSAHPVHDLTPLQSLSSGPWRSADRSADGNPAGIKASCPSPSSHLLPFSSTSSEGGNPSASL
jgi:exoribonuclease R